jgi:hypothetical protein
MFLTQIEIFRFIEFRFVSAVERGLNISGCIVPSMPVRFQKGATMARKFRPTNLMGDLVMFFFFISMGVEMAYAQANGSPKPSAPPTAGSKPWTTRVGTRNNSPIDGFSSLWCRKMADD